MDSDSTMWVIIVVVLVLLFFVVVIVGVGLTIFFIARKRKRAQAAATLESSSVSTSTPVPEVAAAPETPAYDVPAASYEVAPAVSEPAVEPAAPEPVTQPEPIADSGSLDFDPSRTVAISREKTVTISYGTIKFTSGVLAGQEFEVKPEGTYIGREPSLAQIVVSDPRISKRHLWLGVRDGVVKIVDQDSRNGTFINDPQTDRVTEATLNSGDTVILGESDVARFEYHS